MSALSPQVIIDPSITYLPYEAELILLAMFSDCEYILIQKEFGAGLSDTRVYQVELIRNGRRELPQVIKVGLTHLIKQEWLAYNTCIKNHISGIAQIVNSPTDIIEYGWSGLHYPLVGDGQFTIKSLRDYYSQIENEETIRYIIDEQLFKRIRRMWRQATPKIAYPLQNSYDSILPVNLLIDCYPAPSKQKPKPLMPLKRQDSYTKDQFVKISGFEITEIDVKKNLLTLNCPKPEGRGLSYRIRLKNVPDIANYALDQTLSQPIIGRIEETRLSLLSKPVVKMGLDVEDRKFHLKNELILPNPLYTYQNTLAQRLDIRWACIHGDLNLENILIEYDSQSRKVSLIDFARSGEDHVLHDFLRLEANIVVHLLPHELDKANLAPQDIYSFYKWVHCATKQESTAIPSSLKIIYKFITLVRQTAQDYLYDRSNWQEYYQGLLLYLLGMLKFKNLGINAKKVTFWGAATIQSFIQASPPCDDEPQDGILTGLVSPKPEFNDVYTTYKQKANHLLQNLRLNRSNFVFQEALVYKQKLEQTIAQARRYGDTSLYRAECDELLYQLNNLEE